MFKRTSERILLESWLSMSATPWRVVAWSEGIDRFNSGTFHQRFIERGRKHMTAIKAMTVEEHREIHKQIKDAYIHGGSMNQTLRYAHNGEIYHIRYDTATNAYYALQDDGRRLMLAQTLSGALEVINNFEWIPFGHS